MILGTFANIWMMYCRVMVIYKQILIIESTQAWPTLQIAIQKPATASITTKSQRHFTVPDDSFMLNTK
jgi:hypothetical protein